MLYAGFTDGLFQDLEKLARDNPTKTLLIVIDTFGPALNGNENDGEVVTRFMTKLLNFCLRNRNVTWLVLDHSRKNKITEGEQAGVLLICWQHHRMFRFAGYGDPECKPPTFLGRDLCVCRMEVVWIYLQ